MARDRLWNLPEDMWVFQRHSRYSRTIILQVDGEPAQKGPSGRRSAPAFQRQVIEGMRQYGRHPFTGPVALDLHFTARRRQPPMIHNVAKHVLDLLGPALPENAQPRRRHVLYRDDRQVKFLYVELNHAWQSNDPQSAGTTFLTARPGRDAVSDLRAALELQRQDDHEEYESNEDELDDPFRVPDPPDETRWEWPLPRFGDMSPSEAWLYEFTRLHREIELQESLLAGTDGALAHAVAAFFDHVNDVKSPELSEMLRNVEAYNHDVMLSSPLTLPMPALPRTAGASKDFVTAVRECLEDFKSKWQIYGVLHVPVRLTFLVVPPEQGKDLDNIPLAVLPIAHDVLRPHVEPHLVRLQHRGEEPEPWLAEALKRMRSLNANSVSAYQIVELPRSRQDPPEGVLRIALGHHARWSWWDMAAHYVDRMIKRRERNWWRK